MTSDSRRCTPRHELRLQLANPPLQRHDDPLQLANARSKLGVLSRKLALPIVSKGPHHEKSSVEVQRSDARATSHQVEPVVASAMAASSARKLPDPNAPNDPAVEAAFQAVPETMVAEILDGELHSMPRPARRHTSPASLLGGELHAEVA